MRFSSLRSIFLGSPARETFQEIPVIASLLYYSLTIFLARLFRKSIRKTLPQPYQDLAADFVMTFASCACSLENSMIRRAYGFAAYGGIMFTIAMWFVLTVHDGSRGNPCGNMISYMKGDIKLFTMLSRMIFQLLGGLTSYSYARGFWYLELTTGHGQRYANLHCTTDLTVPSPLGFTIEFSATFIDALIAATTFTPFYFVEAGSKMFLGTLMVLSGIHLTGMYMNPVNATNQTFGCHGISAFEHICVYWGGPLLASVLAVVIHQRISSLIKTHMTTATIPPARDMAKVVNGIHELGSAEEMKSADRSAQINDQNIPDKSLKKEMYTADSPENGRKDGTALRHRNRKKNNSTVLRQ